MGHSLQNQVSSNEHFLVCHAIRDIKCNFQLWLLICSSHSNMNLLIWKKHAIFDFSKPVDQIGMWGHLKSKQVSQFKATGFSIKYKNFQNTPILTVSYLDDCRSRLTITMSFVRWKPSSYFAQTIIIVVVVYQSLVIDSRAVGNNICGLFSIGLWAGAVMRYRRNEAVSSSVRPEKVSVGFHSEQLQCKRHLAISAKKSALIIGVYWKNGVKTVLKDTGWKITQNCLRFGTLETLRM